MKLNSRQVSDKLGITISTIRGLVSRKILTDLGQTKKGKTKHSLIFDSKEVNEVAKTYRKRSKKKIELYYGEAGNGKSVMIRDHDSNWPNPIKGINSRLSAIEEKIDILIKTWS